MLASTTPSWRLLLPLLVGLTIYGAASAWYSAKDLDMTADEPVYTYPGQQFLLKHAIEDNLGFPILSPAIGALYPTITHEMYPTPTDKSTLPDFRLGHIVLYVLGGVGVILLLAALQVRWAALIFAWLYFLSPTTKAFASLDITDADAAVFTLLAMSAVIYAWRRPLAPRARMAWFAASFFWLGLAECCKVSAIVWAPLPAVAIAANRQLGVSARIKTLLLGVAAFTLAILVAYQFDFHAFPSLVKTTAYQAWHNRIGHPAFFMGRVNNVGFWPDLIMGLLYKSTIPFLLTLGGALWALYRFRRVLALEALLLFAPAAGLLVLLSAGRIHLGVRYFLPGLLMIMLGSALALQKAGESVPPRRMTVWMLGCLLLLGADWWVDYRALTRTSYLSYFNALAPSPSSRSYLDASNDWGQGIPFHLRDEYPRTYSIATLPLGPFFSAHSRRPIFVAEGAMSLCGFWSTHAPLLRFYQPRWTVAAYEIHEFTRQQLFEFLELGDAVDGEGISLVRTREYDLDAGLERIAQRKPQLVAPACAGSQTWQLGVSEQPGQTFPLGRGKRLIVFQSQSPPTVKVYASPQVQQPLRTLKVFSSQSLPNGMQEWRAWVESTSEPPDSIVRIERTVPARSPDWDARILTFTPSCS